jgi:hypothetical protein
LYTTLVRACAVTNAAAVRGSDERKADKVGREGLPGRVGVRLRSRFTIVGWKEVDLDCLTKGER